MAKETVKPFLKWAGGKGQLLGKFESLFPTDLKKGEVKIYVEPFVGAGAVLFHVLQNYKIEKAYINDINKELINCYKCIKNNVKKVIEALNILEIEYLSSVDREQYYYKIRDKYNKIELNGDEDYDKCAEFIFLNRTCFNGLYRVKKGGGFNVPHGKYKNPLICDRKNLKLCSLILKKVDISYGDYSDAVKNLEAKTFIYFDPPYRPLIENTSFVNYDKYGFNDDDQKKLAKVFKNLNDRKCLIMLSNSDPKNTNKNDNFFDDLYNGFEIDRILAKRMINCQALKRGDVTEIVVTNYENKIKSIENKPTINAINNKIKNKFNQNIKVVKGSRIS